jgi:hypothetical protein
VLGTGLACGGAALALADHSDPLLPAIAAGVVAAGLVGARTAQQLVLFAVLPLLAAIAWGDWLYLAACACVWLAVLAWALGERERPRPERSELTAVRFSLALAAALCAAALLAFVLVFGW